MGPPEPAVIDSPAHPSALQVQGVEDLQPVLAHSHRLHRAGNMLFL